MAYFRFHTPCLFVIGSACASTFFRERLKSRPLSKPSNHKLAASDSFTLNKQTNQNPPNRQNHQASQRPQPRRFICVLGGLLVAQCFALHPSRVYLTGATPRRIISTSVSARTYSISMLCRLEYCVRKEMACLRSCLSKVRNQIYLAGMI